MMRINVMQLLFVVFVLWLVLFMLVLLGCASLKDGDMGDVFGKAISEELRK